MRCRFGEAVFSQPRPDQAARARAFFEQCDFVTFFVERVSGEQAGDACADDGRFASSWIEFT